MALQGLMGDDSYSVVTISRYDKTNSILGIDVLTYADSTKKWVIGSTQFVTNSSASISVLGINQTTPAVSPSIGDKYAVGTGATGEWENHVGKVVEWDGSGWDSCNHPRVWFDDKVYEWSGSNWPHAKYVIDAHVFNKYFSLSQIGGADKDILKACYAYLKTLPAFENCTDV